MLRIFCCGANAVRQADQRPTQVNVSVAVAPQPAAEPVPAPLAALQPIRPPAPPSTTAPEPLYNPRQTYTPTDLLALSVHSNITQDQKIAILTELGLFLSHGFLDLDTRKAICNRLTCSLGSTETIYLEGIPRDAEFFASLNIDLILAGSKPENMALEKRYELADAIDRLLRLSGNTATLKVNGVQQSRDDLRTWSLGLRNPTLKSNQQLTAANMAAQIDGLLKTNKTQSVHETAVIQRGNLVYAELCKRTAHVNRIEFDVCRTSIEALPEATPYLTTIQQALKRIGEDQTRNTSSGLDTKLSSVLSTLWTYIRNHPNGTIRENLQLALLGRLKEIANERPCHTGCLERLLDTPTGIDEDMNVLNITNQIRSELAQIAGHVNNHFGEIFAGTELQLEDNPELNEDIVSELKASVFEQTAKLKLVRIQGLTEASLGKEVEQMKAGF